MKHRVTLELSEAEYETLKEVLELAGGMDSSVDRARNKADGIHNAVDEIRAEMEALATKLSKLGDRLDDIVDEIPATEYDDETTRDILTTLTDQWDFTRERVA